MAKKEELTEIAEQLEVLKKEYFEDIKRRYYEEIRFYAELFTSRSRNYDDLDRFFKNLGETSTKYQKELGDL